MGTAGQKVIVASKLPMSFELQCCAKRPLRQKVRETTWTEEVFYKDGPMFVIAGTAYPLGPTKINKPRPQIFEGAALTFNVDKDVWDRWLEENKNTPMVKNKLVFAHIDAASLQDMAHDRSEFTSGLDPLVPDNDRRMPRKMGVDLNPNAPQQHAGEPAIFTPPSVLGSAITGRDNEV
jgi:hypothetical protein